jgi:hypothetical protein
VPASAAAAAAFRRTAGAVLRIEPQVKPRRIQRPLPSGPSRRHVPPRAKAQSEASARSLRGRYLSSRSANCFDLIALFRFLPGAPLRRRRPVPDAARQVRHVPLQLLQREAEREQPFELTGREVRKLVLALCGEV